MKVSAVIKRLAIADTLNAQQDSYCTLFASKPSRRYVAMLEIGRRAVGRLIHCSLCIKARILDQRPIRSARAAISDLRIWRQTGCSRQPVEICTYIWFFNFVDVIHLSPSFALTRLIKQHLICFLLRLYIKKTHTYMKNKDKSYT